MPGVETIRLDHVPDTHALHVALYQDVANAGFLHQQLLDGNSDFEYAFIDASVIVSRVHALAAAYRAINDLLEGRLRTRNVHAETVFCLSPTNIIAESFRRFGISPTTTSLLVMKVATSPAITASTIQQHLDVAIHGNRVAFEDDVLQGMTDLARVRKYYKLQAGNPGKGKGGFQVNGTVDREERKEMEMQILGTMALRGVS